MLLEKRNWTRPIRIKKPKNAYEYNCFPRDFPCNKALKNLLLSSIKAVSKTAHKSYVIIYVTEVKS